MRALSTRCCALITSDERSMASSSRLIDVAAAKPEEVENKVEEEAVVVTPVHLVDVAAE